MAAAYSYYLSRLLYFSLNPKPQTLNQGLPGSGEHGARGMQSRATRATGVHPWQGSVRCDCEPCCSTLALVVGLGSGDFG